MAMLSSRGLTFKFHAPVRASVEREREMMYYQFPKFSHQDSLKILDADIQHANALASAIPSAKCGARLQMKLGYNHLAPILLYLLQWMDCSCTCLLARYLNLSHVLVYKVYTDGKPNISRHGRKATIRDFYAVILPSLQRLHGNLVEWDDCNEENSDMEITGKTRPECSKGFPMLIWREKMNVGFAWSPAPKWFCPTTVMKCVSTANVIGVTLATLLTSGFIFNAQIPETIVLQS